jgi:hypothetical protein
LGPAFTGGLIIYFGARPIGVEWVLEALGLLVIVSALIWVRNPFGFVFSLAVGALLIYLSRIPDGMIMFWMLQALGVRFAIESISDFHYLFSKQTDEGKPSDTQLLSQHFMLPHWIWGMLIGGTSLLILGTSLYLTWGEIILPIG